MRVVAREERMPWISPGRPGPDRANHSHWSERIVRDAPALLQRATRQSRLIAFYGVGPDGALVRREVKPQVPPEDMGVRCPAYPQVAASRPTLSTPREDVPSVDGTCAI